ncbi:uncharacterized protein LOC129748332 [Uranotaenia lowii]|uniref:uncharacterized protein LOC129748332 n=1 Tax=Uranotaenia lowii TaxID=190385 RepID=UPI00247A897B|nr:uncharacterized protein LOC129748332 [Uranotaenia lowii]
MRSLWVVLSVIVLFGGLTQAGFLDWFRSSENKGHQICKVDFEVMDPRGLKLWTAHKPETKMFGVELFINPVARDGKPPVCNVCQNTTDVMHGKFFIQDDNVVVKKGDVLEYVAITSNGKTTQRHKPRKIVVNDYIIKPQGRCNCPAPIQPSTVHESDSAAEIQLLERIISGLSQRCADGAVSNFLFLQADRPSSGSRDLLEHVRSYLLANKDLKAYAGAVTSAEDYSDGIAFQVKSLIDKLKILEISSTSSDIIDYDSFSTIDKIDLRMSV